jgi:predicted RecA/RadA family phage recombinase
MILMNESGHINPEVTILKEEIETGLGINLGDTEIVNSFLKFTKVGGFNSIWGLPKIQGQALAAGSVIVLKRKDNQKFKVGSLNKFALGLRTSEGYGQFAINTHGFSSIEMIDLKKENNEKFELSLDLIQDFIKFCFKESLESAINEEVFSLITSKKYKNINISGSFLQRMLIFIKNSDSIDSFNENLKALKKKALNQLKKIEEDLYIEDKTVNKEEFEALLETLSKRQIDFNALKDENLKNSNLINYFTRNLVELYKIYCRTFLTNLILKIRGSKNE